MRAGIKNVAPGESAKQNTKNLFRSKPSEEVVVELSRLPPELLRPSSLEAFLGPTTPLTLSSVKVVYSPEGEAQQLQLVGYGSSARVA